MPRTNRRGAISMPKNGQKVSMKMARTLIWTYDGIILSNDGAFGPETKKQFQRYLKLVGRYKGIIDGDWGKQSQTAMQYWIRDRGYYPASKFVIDGVAGSSTWAEAMKVIAREAKITPAPVLPVTAGRYQAMQKFLNWSRIGYRYSDGAWFYKTAVYGGKVL